MQRPTTSIGAAVRRPLSACTALALGALLLAGTAVRGSETPQRLNPEQGDKIVLIGNTLAERMQYFSHFETLLHARFPQRSLVVRNLGWSADELTLRPRSKDFDDHGHTLQDHEPDVLIAVFGFNESFDGEEGLPKFKKNLNNFIQKHKTTKYNGEHPPQLVLLSPIAHEDLGKRTLPDGSRNNENIRLYTDAMRQIAAQKGVLFVDLFAPSRKLYEQTEQPLTINGIHLSDAGYKKLARVLDERLFGPRPKKAGRLRELGKLHAEVDTKNRLFFYDYRAVNGFYIYGGRKKPFGVKNFPAEFKKLRNMLDVHDERIWKIARGDSVPVKPDYGGTGKLPDIKSNVKDPAPILPPEEAAEHFTLPDGYEVNLFASEEEFPALKNPVSMTFDAEGRLWVSVAPSYPHWEPGQPFPNDKILILEDTDGDGRADKQTVFADGLYLPNGFELGDGGAYVAQMPNLMFLKDTDGDDRADVRELVLHGFGTADSHHALGAFRWGPGGGLYFMEGTFHRTQVETPYGPVRCADAGVFRWEPTTWKLDVFVSYRFANPWGICFDRWGQTFVADASGGRNYFGTAFSGDVDYPRKHGKLQTFLIKQWRPTCGCEVVSSRNFPEKTQGDYLLNNVIGFQGVLRYRFKETGSGFFAEPVEPLLRSSDPTFRPVDQMFGPDGALYVVDWCNPLIGHMQHSIRDPNRDTSHGRIWRVRYTKKSLVQPPQIAGQPIPELLDLLKVYEDRIRYRVRRELRNRDTEKLMAALDEWTANRDKEGEHYWHHLLEALWVHQHHDVVDQALLKKLLACPEPSARAAATRVAGYWRDRLDEPLALLRERVNDEHPRVRLEAVRALSFFEEGRADEALEVAVESLVYEQDDYLKYTLQETMDTLERRTGEK